ncbi:hypothetical protein RRG08_062146 [Elysia crispata]|uniref:Uncharacterized protein n=1 Tax=Elysia crispata TaxID=231223 RepID=A0AAE0YN25_9GAST|nr:hypothetical protein RRG08_062146 [Elysia crispata]
MILTRDLGGNYRNPVVITFSSMIRSSVSSPPAPTKAIHTNSPQHPSTHKTPLILVYTTPNEALISCSGDRWLVRGRAREHLSPCPPPPPSEASLMLALGRTLAYLSSPVTGIFAFLPGSRLGSCDLAQRPISRGWKA